MPLLKHKTKSAAFTLVETLVAIAILNLSIAAAFTAAQTGLSSSIFSRDQITASFLAQEGVEFVRNLRDENNLSGLPWTSGLEPCIGGSYCVIDAVNKTVASCSGTSESCPFIRHDQTPSSLTYDLYGHNSAWVVTNFRRAISVTVVSPYEIAVDVDMYWTKGNLNRQFNVRANLYNWQ